jgi:hypothetical protein
MIILTDLVRNSLFRPRYQQKVKNLLSGVVSSEDGFIKNFFPYATSI